MDSTSKLREFFRFIWKEEKGHAYIATKDPQTHAWEKKFFEWPIAESDIITTVFSKSQSHEVYCAPSLFSKPTGRKEDVKGSSVVWVEFDGKIPPNFGELPVPSYVVQTSDENHLHIYWSVESLLEVETLESINRALTYALDADSSGWDANQVLRPPETFNHKKSRTVQTVSKNLSDYSHSSFTTLPAPPKVAFNTDVVLPEVADVIRRNNPIPDKTWRLFKEGVKKDRSGGLYVLACELAELRMRGVDVLALLKNADDRWGKFSTRSDQLKRLMEITAKAVLSFNSKTRIDPVATEALSELALQATEVKLEWVWEGILQKGGCFLISGSPGVGKTSFSLQFASKVALGEPFLDIPVLNASRIGILSLEMGLVDLKAFRTTQLQGYTQEQQAILDKNLIYWPIGESLYMSDYSNRLFVETLIQDYELDGIIIDTLFSVVKETQDEDIKFFFDWVDHIRKTYGVFVWLIHHNRKGGVGNTRPKKLDDVYGSVLITGKPTTVMMLYKSDPSKAEAEVIPLKVRLARTPEPFYIVRGNHLDYAKTEKKDKSKERFDLELDLSGSKEEDDVDVTDKPTNSGDLSF